MNEKEEIVSSDKVAEPRIELLGEKKLIGQHLTMSMTENNTFKLWNGFMPRRKEIRNATTSNLIAMQVFGPEFDFQNFDVNAPFEKWAAVEVSGFSLIPHGMESFILPPGMYAVFVHRGPAREGERTFRHIFSTWIPASKYEIDHRPHFEVLGEKYKHDSPDSEEEVWIPVKSKGI